MTGRQPSIWDDFCRESEDRACANVADDMLHRYEDDVQVMSDYGLESYRFSISWSRVMSWNGTAMNPNPDGIAFYRNLIRALREKRIEPILTMYHWDLPSALHTALSPKGWLNPSIVDYFDQYTNLLYHEFGADVKFWSTFNEPWSFVTLGYGLGVHAPGMSNSTTNTYLAAHHVLLSHAAAVTRFRALKETQIVREDARISIVLNCDFAYPLNPNNPSDVAAAERKMQFSLGWFLDPIIRGEYPAVMVEFAGDHLPVFSRKESSVLKGSYDLFMLNHYTSNLITPCDSIESNTPCEDLSPGWFRDMAIDSRLPPGARLSSVNEHGGHNCEWFGGYPEGYLETIRWMHRKDVHAEILLTENGWCGNATVDNQDQLWYYESYLQQVMNALREGIPILGYTAWSFLDNYEWGSFEPRFGLFYVEYPPQVGSHAGYTPKPTDLQRIARPAAGFISRIAKTKCFPEAEAEAEATSNPTFLVLCFSMVIGSNLAFYLYRRRRSATLYDKII
eukprot:CAMPEP_0194363558 /NCGR_PEP_ID=MMETSP0174-20130528/11377_1 /TAXON_ID=216777 /ORGANISM="Proboscia alata, Strain PI-D3" /LENGTH=505 /DNA_ID=CAMNT_0039137039 /DNA_START=172 /DNA_END=1689 /DNA_ORIENTATION=+